MASNPVGFETRKTVVITGGNRGIGRNTSLNLSTRGVDIIFTYHSNKAEADSLISEVEGMGQKAAAFRLDTADVRHSTTLSQKFAVRYSPGQGSGLTTL